MRFTETVLETCTYGVNGGSWKIEPPPPSPRQPHPTSAPFSVLPPPPKKKSPPLYIVQAVRAPCSQKKFLAPTVAPIPRHWPPPPLLLAHPHQPTGAPPPPALCSPHAPLIKLKLAVASYWRSQLLAGRLRAIRPMLVGYVLYNVELFYRKVFDRNISTLQLYFDC